MTLYTLGALDIGPQTIDGPNYAQSSRRVMVLSNGLSERNEVLQEGALPSRNWQITGLLFDAADAAILTDYNKAKTTVTFVDPVLAESYSVYVFDCSIRRRYPLFWEYSITLVEIEPGAETS